MYYRDETGTSYTDRWVHQGGHSNYGDISLGMRKEHKPKREVVESKKVTDLINYFREIHGLKKTTN